MDLDVDMECIWFGYEFNEMEESYLEELKG